MNPLHDPVCVLLEIPFSKWTESDKKDFLRYKNPTPLLLNVNKVAKRKDKVYEQNVKTLSWCLEFELLSFKFEWLCSSFYLNKLFCMTCLIIGFRQSVWSKHGFNGNATRATLRKHEGSSEHIRCELEFSKLKKKINAVVDDSQENYMLYVKYYNENVQLNRSFMQLAIRAVIYLDRQGLPFCGQYEECSNFKELLENFISISPVDSQEHYKNNISLNVKCYNTFQNQIIDCISQHIDEDIENEVKDCDFFSIQVDNLTDIVQEYKCSVIIRYVRHGGELVERLLGLYDISQSADSIISNCLEKFSYESKLIGLSLDGTSMVSGQSSDLWTIVKETAPQAAFVHSSTHPLNFVLQQSCNSISKCRVFLATVHSLSEFFKRAHVVDRRIPKSAISRWTSNSKVLSVINNEWDAVKEVLTDIMNDPISDQATVSQSHCFLNKFHDLEFAFLVVAFSNIFAVTNELCDALQKQFFDVNFCISRIKDTQTRLNIIKDEDTFKDILDLAASRTPVRSTDREKLDRENYKILYYAILGIISLQIHTRFEDMAKLSFIKLMDTSKFVQFSEKFPTDALNNLKVHYSNIFTDIRRLRNELELIYDDGQYRDVKPQDFMKQLHENHKIFREAYKLFSLILAIPSTDMPVEQSVSCWERVKAHLRNNMTQDGVMNPSKISIEKELLNELMSDRLFYDDIIYRFGTLEDRTIDVVYKE